MTMIPSEVAAQAAPVRALTSVTTVRPTARPTAVLRPSYQLRLESAWPAPEGESDACNNRASETLTGWLRRVATNRYEGRFVRETRLGFCGRHGPAVQACGAVLSGNGEVGVVGEVTAGAGGRPVMALFWQAIPGTTRIRIEGSCAPKFSEALEAMYRGAVHSVDFAVPDAGSHRMSLDDYGRTLHIR
jgi:hypothetical protein